MEKLLKEKEASAPTAASAPPTPSAILTDERVKKQLEKLVELGFNEGSAATALVQCSGDLGDAVTMLLAASGRLG